MKEKIFAFIDQLAAAPHPGWWLFLLAFAESSFFPIPPDVLLITLGVATPERAIWYGLVCSVGSVLGGVLGYGIGLYGGRPLLYKFFAEKKIHGVERLYDRYNAWATGIAGLTPIPYKVFTITGGVCKISFATLVAASALGRAGRFFLVGGLIYRFGEPVRTFIEKYLGWLTIAFAILLIGGFVVIKRLLH